MYTSLPTNFFLNDIEAPLPDLTTLPVNKLSGDTVISCTKTPILSLVASTLSLNISCFFTMLYHLYSY
jgi:hypothetical protein